MLCTQPISSNVPTIHLQCQSLTMNPWKVSSCSLLTLTHSGFRKLVAQSFLTEAKSTEIQWQSVCLRTSDISSVSKQKCVPYNQKCLVSIPNQNIATSVVVIHIFHTSLNQEKQCRRMDSSETLHIVCLKNPLYKDISCIELGRIVRTVKILIIWKQKWHKLSPIMRTTIARSFSWPVVNVTEKTLELEFS